MNTFCLCYDEWGKKKPPSFSSCGLISPKVTWRDVKYIYGKDPRSSGQLEQFYYWNETALSNASNQSFAKDIVRVLHNISPQQIMKSFCLVGLKNVTHSKKIGKITTMVVFLNMVFHEINFDRQILTVAPIRVSLFLFFNPLSFSFSERFLLANLLAP